MKRDVLILSCAIVCGILIGVGIGYWIYHREPTPIPPDQEVHRLDSINLVLTDSVAKLQERKCKADSAYYAERELKVIFKIKYDELRKKVGSANAGVSVGLLEHFLQ